MSAFYVTVWFMVVDAGGAGGLVIPTWYSTKEACVAAADAGDVGYFKCIPSEIRETK